ncbi:MAG: histidinol-phosphatase [Planctomycetales bacterium]|nr:histidinol-phosphatase [Planctomycetales bacterium]
MSDIESRLEFAKKIAFEAGRRTLDHFSPDIKVERKSDNSPVTIADRDAEQYLRKRIGEEFPDDAILGEEFGEQEGKSGYRWILDPIDGTKSFITGVPLYGTLIAVEQDNEPKIGVIELPALDRRIYAAIGSGAEWQEGYNAPKPARVSETTDLNDCVYLTSEVKTFHQRDAMDAHHELEEACWFGRTWGDCYAYFLVATGQAEIVVDPMMSLWDAAALLPVLVEAGGTFTDWRGRPTIHSGEGVATNGKVLSEVISITGRYGSRADR